MKKGGIAIEQILYIFLMVVIILVASSFLLKALGIDIFGWVSEMFAPLVKPTANPALVIKIDPHDSPVEVWEVYLTKSTSILAERSEFWGSIPPVSFCKWEDYFMLEKFPSRECTIFTIDENGAVWQYCWGHIGHGDSMDEGFIYYVKPGVAIQDKCESLEKCLGGRYEGGCIGLHVFREGDCDKNECYEEDGSKTSCRGRYNFVNCYKGFEGNWLARCDEVNPDLRMIEKTQFTDDARFVGPCELEKGTPKDFSKCNLVVPGKYRIKYGIICDENGIWQPCTDERAKKLDKVYVEGKEYQCKCEGETCFWE